MAQYQAGRRVRDFQDSVCLGSGYKPASHDTSDESPYYATSDSRKSRPYEYPTSRKYPGPGPRATNGSARPPNPQTQRAHQDSHRRSRPPRQTAKPRRTGRRLAIALGVILGILLLAAIVLLALWLTGIIFQPNNEPTRFPATPPMGWRTGGAFYCDLLTQPVVQRATDAVANGYSHVGYSYIVIDDCWQSSRNYSGALMPDSSKFPAGYQGMKSLGQYINSKGLKLGLSTSVGTLTCLRRQGGWLHQLNDSKYFNDLGAEFVHGDDCFLYPGPTSRVNAYKEMTSALATLPRPVVSSVHSSTPEGGSVDAHVVQLADYILDDWYEMWAHLDRVNAANQTASSRPGYWVDLGPLTVGQGGMTTSEYKVQFSLWCVLKSPLLMGNDLEKVTDQLDRYLLQNEDMIQINQDRLGVPAAMISRKLVSPPSKLTQTLGVTYPCVTGSTDQDWEYVRQNKWLRIHDRCLGRDLDGHVTIKNCFASDSSLLWDLDTAGGRLHPNLDPTRCLTLSTSSRVPAKVRRCDARQTTRNWQGANQWWHGFNDAFQFEVLVNNSFDFRFVVRNSNDHCLSVGLTETHEIYAGPMADESFVVLMVNRDTESHELMFEWREVPGMNPNKVYYARDMYEKRELGGYSTSYSERISPHSCAILVFRPVF